MEVNRQSKATILFALAFLEANFDDAKELMADSSCFSEVVGKVRPPQSAEEIHALSQLLLKDEIPNEERKISYVLRDDDLGFDVGSTLEELLNVGGSLLDHCMDPPVAVFKIEGDERWFVATTEMTIAEANPAFVVEAIHEQLDWLEREQGTEESADETERHFLQHELARLTPQQAGDQDG